VHSTLSGLHHFLVKLRGHSLNALAHALYQLCQFSILLHKRHKLFSLLSGDYLSLLCGDCKRFPMLGVGLRKRFIPVCLTRLG
jgi:hypothetical protein